jgi:hypothetical protein
MIEIFEFAVVACCVRDANADGGVMCVYVENIHLILLYVLSAAAFFSSDAICLV